MIRLQSHVVTFEGDVPPGEVTQACPDCFQANDGQGVFCGRLGATDAASIARLAASCDLLRAAIAGGQNISALADDLPHPAWYPRLGLVPSIEAHILLPHAVLSDSNLLRGHVRGRFGRTDTTSVSAIDTPIGRIQIDDVYENHFFDVDPRTGQDRRDPDHVFFIPLVRETLTRPIEVWEVQEGGRRTRRLMFIKLYLLEEMYAYHLAVATRDGKLLTAHRIKGLTACQARRLGRPRYMAY